MKIAIAQLNPIIGNLDFNSQKILEAARCSVDQGVRLLLTPELSLCGYPPRDLLLKPAFIQAMATKLQELAAQLPPELAVLVGVACQNEQAYAEGEKPLYNSIAYLEAGKVRQYFHKRLLPNYDVFDEYRYFAAGKVSEILQLDGIRIGITICEDLWNDASFWGKKSYYINPIEELLELDINLIINLSASPYTVGKQALRRAMLQYTAQAYTVPIIYINQVGGNDDLIFDGHSTAFNCKGELVLQAEGFQEALEIVKYSEADLEISKQAKLEETEEAEIWSALVLGVRDYARKCGFSKAILGLSGGIDSALVAVIAAESLGANNVLAMLMPSPYSSDHSITDAQALAQNLGIATSILPIEQLMQDYAKVLDPLFGKGDLGIAEENIQSRIRGNLLMAMANKFGYLLLSTGNKSELAVGYCTLYGDMNGGLATIADLPKTKVYQLCRWLNREREIIPAHILNKPPSAELRPGQLDQDSLPPYEILDEILDRMIEKYQSKEEISAAGYDPTIVGKVMDLVFKSEFKRKQAPPGLKITDRAFGTGWRMPIASRWF
jgi:NAD+ synthase (glutamine-hydrolysing)